MERVPIGGTGVQVSEVILGCGSIGGVGSARDTWGKYGQSEAEAFEIGVNVLDTAVSYAGGESETVIGHWLSDRGQRAVVATKAGGVVEDGLPRIDLSSANLTRAPDDQTPIAETLEALAAFIEQGLGRSIGACNVSEDQLRAALDTSDRLGLPRYEWVQNEYSLLARSDDTTVIPLCVERGLGYTPHSPLCGGILSGKVRQGVRIVSLAAVVAVGVRDSGEKSVLGLAVGASETEAFWLEFCRSLARRGLSGVQLVISDAHEGLRSALAQVFAGAAWQRCKVDNSVRLVYQAYASFVNPPYAWLSKR
jgi:diketogulonate reductase-like aldo/keto reductase